MISPSSAEEEAIKQVETSIFVPVMLEINGSADPESQVEGTVSCHGGMGAIW